MADKKPTKQEELDNSIRLSLDAAEAAMDVTTEYSEIGSKFDNALKSSKRLHKVGMLSLVCGLGTGIIAALVVVFLYMAQVSNLDNIAKSNMALLKVFTEKMALFEENKKEMQKLNLEILALNDKIGGGTIDKKLQELAVDFQNISDKTLTPMIESNLKSLGDRITNSNGKMTELTIAELNKRVGKFNSSIKKAVGDINRFSKGTGRKISDIRSELRGLRRDYGVIGKRLKRVENNLIILKSTTAKMKQQKNDEIKFGG